MYLLRLNWVIIFALSMSILILVLVVLLIPKILICIMMLVPICRSFIANILVVIMSNFFFPSLSFNDWLKRFPCYDRLLSTPDTYLRRIFLSYWFTSLPCSDVCLHCFGCGSGLDGILDVFFKGEPPHENENFFNR